MERLKSAVEADGGPSMIVATHYYNPDDERQLQGVSDPSQINQLYVSQKENESPEDKKKNRDNEKELHLQIDSAAKGEDDENGGGGNGETARNNPAKKFMEMGDTEIEVEEGRTYEKDVENVFGRKIALGLIALNWKMKEVSMKIIYKQAEKFLNKDN